ncbi:MAG: ferredoxin:thioredoxin reductase [Methanoregulaceae archaeon]|nr:ferredoxin:thioredoxin reductase [Methanoregulaceae archaeon]NTV00931.1 ferredoxin:thioredoxin reductase [Methanoregulaceae archaeon]
MTKDETAEEHQVLTWAEHFAKKHHFILNPDKKKLDVVIRGLARNKRKFGEQYCPCRLRSGDKEKDAAIICPCIYHADEVEQEGSCHCSLYFREDAQPE